MVAPTVDALSRPPSENPAVRRNIALEVPGVVFVIAVGELVLGAALMLFGHGEVGGLAVTSGLWILQHRNTG